MTNKSPKITVLLPVHNGYDYVQQAVESIQKQTFRDFELLIIDDASKDNTWDLLQRLASKDKRITLVHNDINLGLTKTLNKGLLLAKGEYIARQDHDDISLIDRLEKEINFLYSHPEVALVGTHCYFIDSLGKRFSQWQPPLNNEEIRLELQKGNSFCHGSVMFRKSLIEKVGLYREKLRYVEDYDYWYRISDKFKVANIGEYLYELRRGLPTISSKNLNEQINYHLLTRELGKERQKSDSDSLDLLNLQSIEELLINRYSLQKRDIVDFKEQYISRFYYHAFHTKNRKALLSNGWKYYKVNPEKWKIRKIIIDFLTICKNKETT